MKNTIKKCLVMMLAVLILMAACITSVSASETETAQPQALLALGDSLTTGYGLDNYVPGGNPYQCNSYINTIAKALGLEGGQSYINRAVNGDRSADLAKLLPSLENEVKSAELIIITIGGNDLLSTVPTIASKISGKNITDFAGAIGVFAATPPETYATLAADPAFQAQMAAIFAGLATNLQTIAGFLKEKASDARIVFLKQYNPLANVPGFAAFGEFAGGLLDSINSTIEKTCLAYGFDVVDVPSVIDSNAIGLTNITKYDIHPNEQGHAEIAKLLADHLDISLDASGDNQETQSPEVTTEPSVETTAPSEGVTTAPEETVPEDTTAHEEIATAAPNAETSPAETDVEHSQAPVTIPESENTTDTVSQNGCASSVGVLSILVASLVAFAMKKKSH